MIYLDLDDFCESNASWDLLHRLRREIPQVRVNLFTIPGLCLPEWVARLRESAGEWLDLIPHGWAHTSARECEHWDRRKCEQYFDWLEKNYPAMTHGWKAPGWQISDAMYPVLVERGYWLADQAYNRKRRPERLKVYEIDSPFRIHGHIGHLGGWNNNELSLLWPQVTKYRDRPFGFIRDLMCQPTKS